MKAGSLPPIPAEPRRHGHPLTHCFTPPWHLLHPSLATEAKLPLENQPRASARLLTTPKHTMRGHTALPKNQQQLEELVAGAADSPLERPVSILRQNHRFYQLPSARCSCAVAAAQAARGEAGWPRPAGREGEQRASGSSHGDFPAPLAFRQKKSSSTRGWSPQRGRAVPHGPHEPLEGTSKQGDESQGP